MKRIILLLLVIGACLSAQAQITLDTHCSLGNGSTSATTVACTLAVTAGDLIAVGGVSSDSGTPTLSVADNTNVGAYSVAVAQHNDVTSGAITGMWYFKSSLSGSITVTLTSSASVQFMAVAAASFKGVDTISPLGPTNQADGTGAIPPPDSGPITPAVNGALIFSIIGYGNSIAGAGTGFTLLDNVTNTGLADEYQVQGTAATVDGTFNAGGVSQNWTVQVAAFNPASGVASSKIGGSSIIGGASKVQ